MKPCVARLLPPLLLLALFLSPLPPNARAEAARPDWREALDGEIRALDRAFEGRVGVYVKRLDSGETFAYEAGRPWYLGSSAKLAIALTLMEEVDAGRIDLRQRLAVRTADKVDGSGALVWQDEGTEHDVASLLRRMLMESDNTAANMLVRRVGADLLNRRAREWLGPQGFRGLTDFTQVRRDVYAELHPDAARIANLDLVRIAAAPPGPQRVEAVRRTLDVPRSALRVQTIDAAYDRYYERGLNAASLEGYGRMLERFVRGELVSPTSMQRLYRDLKFDTYDAYRPEAGLPRTVRFIHKTGTQYRRACHMGVIDPQDGGARAIVVATCAEDLDEMRDAGRLFERIGRAITRTALRDRDAAAAEGAARPR